jgi:hypothetical protein
MLSDAILTKVTTAIHWLQRNNPLIQRYGFGPDQVQHMPASFPYATLSIPEVTQDWDHIEPPLPHGHPDIIVDPRDYHSDVHGEDHRYFRLPAGLAFTARDGQRAQAITNGPFVVPHGDPDLEALLFTSLYHNGKGAWHYTKPQVPHTYFPFCMLIHCRIE